MTVGGLQIEEDMEMHESEKFVKIEIPATKTKSAVTIIHDFGQNLTQYRQAGQCFLLSNFGAFSTRMNDWLQEFDEVSVADEEEVSLYNFTAAPFSIDRNSLPLVIQHGCEVIYPAVLHNTVHGKAALEEVETTNSTYVGKAFGPQPIWQLGKLGRQGRPKRLFGKLIVAIVIGIFVATAVGISFGGGIATELEKSKTN